MSEQSKTPRDILAELKQVRTLLDEQGGMRDDEDIPLLDNAFRNKPAMPAHPVMPLAGEATTPGSTGQPAALPAEAELDALLEKLINREMPRIRIELKRVLRDELRLRQLLK